MSVLLQSEIDLSTPQTTPEQQLLAWVVICIAALIVAWRLWSAHYAGLPSRLKRAKADLRGARQDTGLRQAYLDAEEAANASTVRATVGDLLDGEASGDPRVRDAASSVRGALAETWSPYWFRLPKTARRIGALGVLVALLGSVAVSTELLLSLLESSGPRLVPLQWPGIAVEYTIRVGEEGHALLSGLPIAGPTLSFTFAVVVSAVSLAFPAWYLWARRFSVLGARGVSPASERRVGDDVTPDSGSAPPRAVGGRAGGRARRVRALGSGAGRYRTRSAPRPAGARHAVRAGRGKWRAVHVPRGRWRAPLAPP